MSQSNVLHLPKVGVKGRVKAELIDAKSGLIKRCLEFDNLIVDTGLNGWWGEGLTLPTLIDECAVGTSNVTPAVTDTGLGAFLASTRSNGGTADVHGWRSADGRWEYTRTRLFVESEANGNLTEFGMGNYLLSRYWSRALFKDATGNPTTITKTSADQLRITYTLYIYPQATPVSSVITLNGVNYTIDVQTVDADTASVSRFGEFYQRYSYSINGRASEVYAMGNVESAPAAGTSATVSSWGPYAYTAGNFYRDVHLTWEPAVANFPTGIQGGFLKTSDGSGNGVYMGFVFTPKIPKVDTERFRLVLRFSWGRV